MPSTIHQRRFLFLPIFLLFFGISSVFAQQENRIQQFLTEGNEWHAKGDYKKASEKYNEALLLNLKHDQANYLMAANYFDMGEYGKCVLHCDKAIHMLSAFDQEAYMLKGKALIKDKKEVHAINNYNKMLVEYPDNYLAYYHMAVAYSNIGSFNDAETALFTALSLKPNHAESHLLMGNVMIKKGESLKAVMALTNFLMLEPRGKRAGEVYNKLQRQLPKAFGNMNDDISTLSLITDMSTNQFLTTEAMYSIVSGEKIESNDGDVLARNTQALLDRLTLMKKETSQWWEFYVNFYNDLNYNKHLETVSYFISQSQNLEEIKVWLVDNHQKVGQMIDWVNAYDR